MSKQEKLEKQRIGGMLICLALLTAGSMLFLPRLVRMGLQPFVMPGFVAGSAWACSA